MTFGDWIVLSFSHKAEKEYNSKLHRFYFWLCRCKCGKQFSVDINNLKSGGSKQCKPCSYTNSIKNSNCHKKYPYPAIFNKMYTSYKHVAKRKSLEWGLTREQFWELSQKNYNYCGIQPQIRKDQNLFDNFCGLNGLDRVNNNLGYIINNVVSCCEMCNSLKQDYDINDFYSQIIKIYQFKIKNV